MFEQIYYSLGKLNNAILPLGGFSGIAEGKFSSFFSSSSFAAGARFMLSLCVSCCSKVGDVEKGLSIFSASWRNGELPVLQSEIVCTKTWDNYIRTAI